MTKGELSLRIGKKIWIVIFLKNWKCHWLCIRGMLNCISIIKIKKTKEMHWHNMPSHFFSCLSAFFLSFITLSVHLFFFFIVSLNISWSNPLNSMTFFFLFQTLTSSFYPQSWPRVLTSIITPFCHLSIGKQASKLFILFTIKNKTN